jgi:hypothetical protein
MNYLCLVDGVVEYASTSESSFAHYQLMYAEEHQDADVQYLTLTDEEYDAMFPVEDDEFSDPCPDCGKELEDAPGGGVKCSCGYWFCY